MPIKKIFARQILDSRGHPTVEVDVTLESGVMSRASVPSGASTGQREALELRDNDLDFGGFAEKKAVKNVNEILAPALVGMDAIDQEQIDLNMISIDGTENKSRVGANAILGVSIAVLKAAAQENKLPLYKYIHERFRQDEEYIIPIPCMNMMNGGKHAQDSSDFQEYMLIPFAKTYHEAIENAAEVFYTLKKILHEKGLSTLVGDEGGFAPRMNSNRQPLDIMMEAIEKAGYRVGQDFGFALDPASSSFVEEKDDKFLYHLESEDKVLSTDQMIDYYEGLINNYPIVSLEDGVSENDWAGWQKLYAKIGKRVQVVGDDLFVTNIDLVKKGHELNAANAVLVKPNQIGSISETIKTVNQAKEYGWHTMLSHRSGETEDTTIADLAVGLNTMQLKSGSLSRSERLAKYNQLLRIEEELDDKAKYLGKDAFVFNK